MVFEKFFGRQKGLRQNLERGVQREAGASANSTTEEVDADVAAAMASISEESDDPHAPVVAPSKTTGPANSRIGVGEELRSGAKDALPTRPKGAPSEVQKVYNSTAWTGRSPAPERAVTTTSDPREREIEILGAHRREVSGKGDSITVTEVVGDMDVLIGAAEKARGTDSSKDKKRPAILPSRGATEGAIEEEKKDAIRGRVIPTLARPVKNVQAQNPPDARTEPLPRRPGKSDTIHHVALATDLEVRKVTGQPGAGHTTHGQYHETAAKKLGKDVVPPEPETKTPVRAASLGAAAVHDVETNAGVKLNKPVEKVTEGDVSFIGKEYLKAKAEGRDAEAAKTPGYGTVLSGAARDAVVRAQEKDVEALKKNTAHTNRGKGTQRNAGKGTGVTRAQFRRTPLEGASQKEVVTPETTFASESAERAAYVLSGAAHRELRALFDGQPGDPDADAVIKYLDENVKYLTGNDDDEQQKAFEGLKGVLGGNEMLAEKVRTAVLYDYLQYLRPMIADDRERTPRPVVASTPAAPKAVETPPVTERKNVADMTDAEYLIHISQGNTPGRTAAGKTAEADEGGGEGGEEPPDLPEAALASVADHLGALGEAAGDITAPESIVTFLKRQGKTSVLTRVLGATAIVGLGIGVGTFAAAPLAASAGIAGIAGTTGAGMLVGLLTGATTGAVRSTFSADRANRLLRERQAQGLETDTRLEHRGWHISKQAAWGSLFGAIGGGVGGYFSEEIKAGLNSAGDWLSNQWQGFNGVAALGTKVDAMGTTLADHTTALESVDAKLGALDTRLDGVGDTLNHVLRHVHENGRTLDDVLRELYAQGDDISALGASISDLPADIQVFIERYPTIIENYYILEKGDIVPEITVPNIGSLTIAADNPWDAAGLLVDKFEGLSGQEALWLQDAIEDYVQDESARRYGGKSPQLVADLLERLTGIDGAQADKLPSGVSFNYEAMFKDESIVGDLTKRIDGASDLTDATKEKFRTIIEQLSTRAGR